MTERIENIYGPTLFNATRLQIRIHQGGGGGGAALSISGILFSDF